MEKIQGIKRLKSRGLRMFLLNKLKKFGTRDVALAVQSVLRLFRTGSFDLRTLTMLSRPMRKKNYDDFKRLVSESLG